MIHIGSIILLPWIYKYTPTMTIGTYHLENSYVTNFDNHGGTIFVINVLSVDYFKTKMRSCFIYVFF